jgi:hypothetical protein
LNLTALIVGLGWTELAFKFTELAGAFFSDESMLTAIANFNACSSE